MFLDRIQKTFISLTVRNYRLYFIGQAISISGTFMQSIAQTWLVLKLTNSGVDVGIVAGLQVLPVLLFAPLGGLLADTFSKRRLLLITQISASVLALLLGLLVLSDEVQLWMVFCFSFALGLVNMVDVPTRQSFVFEMTGDEHIKNAVTLSSTLTNVARFTGVLIGGVLITTVGLAQCFLINSVSYIAVIIALLMIRNSELLPVLRDVSGKIGGLREGFRYIMSSSILKNTFLMMALIGTLSFEFPVSLPLLAQKIFHGDANVYAILMAAMSIGAVVGGLITATRVKNFSYMLPLAAGMFGCSIIIASFSPTLMIAIIALFCVGVLDINLTSLGNTVVQLETKGNMRGRVMAVWTMCLFGSTAIGGPLIGLVGQCIGARWGLATGGLAALLAALIGMWTLKRN